MENKPIQKMQWIRIVMFLIACALSAYSVITNKVEIALLSSVTLFFAFVNLKKKTTGKEVKVIFNRYELTSDQLVLSMALFFYAIVSGVAAAFLSPQTSNGTISLILWVIAIGLLFATGIVFDKIQPFSWNKHVKSLDATARRNFYLEVGAVTAITLLAFVLRVAYLDRYPPSMHGDEGEIGMEALRFLGIGEPISPMGIGWGPLPNLYFLWEAGFIAVFGRNLIGLRLVSALFGTACIPLVYLIGKRSWGKVAGFTGAWLIAVSSLNIQYSRLAINNIHTLFFMLLFIWLFLQSNFDDPSKTKEETTTNDAGWSDNQKFRITPYIAMGVAGAMAQYMYIGSRLIPIVAFFIILYQLFRKRINLVQISVMLISALLVFAPLGLDYLRNPDQFISRLSTVSILNPANIQNNYGLDATLSNSLLKILVSQFDKNLGFFLQSGDAGSFYFQSIPAFDLITAVLFWLGLGVILARPKRLPELTVIIWFFIGIILAGVITNDSPNSTRLLILTAVSYLCGGAFLQRTWDSVNNFYKQIPNIHISLAAILAPAFIAILTAVMIINFNYYFVVYANSGVNILPITIAKEIAQDSPNNHVFLFGDGDLYTHHGTINYLIGEEKAIDITSLEDLPELKKDGKGIIVLATYSNFDQLSQIQSQYPDGKATDEYQNGKLVYKKFQIPALP
ncbi:MAG: glycosyltransferase family 39 protein [Anaerolineaceae bacterium]